MYTKKLPAVYLSNQIEAIGVLMTRGTCPLTTQPYCAVIAIKIIQSKFFPLDCSNIQNKVRPFYTIHLTWSTRKLIYYMSTKILYGQGIKV